MTRNLVCNYRSSRIICRLWLSFGLFGYFRRKDIKPKLKTYKGGNDYEIFESERTIGHTVTSWKDTMEQCTKLFLNWTQFQPGSHLSDSIRGTLLLNCSYCITLALILYKCFRKTTIRRHFLKLLNSNSINHNTVQSIWASNGINAMYFFTKTGVISYFIQ